MPSTRPAPSAAPAPTRQLRVSVKASVRDPNLFVVRPLPDGHQLPPGTREGLLMMVDGADGPFASSGAETGAE
jgi:hypothetical protein